MSYIEVHYGHEEGNPERHKSFRQAQSERERLAGLLCLELQRKGFKEVTPYLVARDGETRGYWELSDAGLGEFVDMDG